MHVGGVEPHEERLAGLVLARDEVLGRRDELVVAGLHPLLGERAGVLDLLLADAAPALLLGRIVLVLRPAVKHPARSEPLAELREVLGRRIVVHLRLLLGVEVVEVAEELVEAVHGRQILVEIAQMVLAELAGGVTLVLEELRNRHGLSLEADRCGWDADLGQAGAIDALPGDEGRAAGGAGLLTVGVGEHHAFLGEPVDVGRVVAH